MYESIVYKLKNFQKVSLFGCLKKFINIGLNIALKNENSLEYLKVKVVKV